MKITERLLNLEKKILFFKQCIVNIKLMTLSKEVSVSTTYKAKYWLVQYYFVRLNTSIWLLKEAQRGDKIAQLKKEKKRKKKHPFLTLPVDQTITQTHAYKSAWLTSTGLHGARVGTWPSTCQHRCGPRLWPKWVCSWSRPNCQSIFPLFPV